MGRDARSSNTKRRFEICERFAKNRFASDKRGKFATLETVATTIFSAIFLNISLAAASVEAAVYQTANFTVQAESTDFAREVGETAERFRFELSQLWLGKTTPQWGSPCKIQVKVGEKLGAGGNLSFTFDKGEVFGWSMTIQGSRERILDSVLPHEITHTIFASQLREPVPRWIDEGAATSVESNVERANYRNMLVGFMKEKRALPFLQMVRLKEYPQDSKDMLTFYSQGFSVCEYLIMIGGNRRLLEFAELGTKSGDWNHALQKIYDIQNLGELQLAWTDWISRWYAEYYLVGNPGEFPSVVKLPEYSENVAVAANWVKLNAESSSPSATPASATVATNGNLAVSPAATSTTAENPSVQNGVFNENPIARSENSATKNENLIAQPGNPTAKNENPIVQPGNPTAQAANPIAASNGFASGVGSATPHFSARETGLRADDRLNADRAASNAPVSPQATRSPQNGSNSLINDSDSLKNAPISPDASSSIAPPIPNDASPFASAFQSRSPRTATDDLKSIVVDSVVPYRGSYGNRFDSNAVHSSLAGSANALLDDPANRSFNAETRILGQMKQ